MVLYSAVIPGERCERSAREGDPGISIERNTYDSHFIVKIPTFAKPWVPFPRANAVRASAFAEAAADKIKRETRRSLGVGGRRE
jgi:hypothetical protein